jgi:signal transduction histidine kinase/ActR/RegA family two-component response regulator
MPVSIRSRLLLLVLSVLLPALLAALWLIVRTYDTEREMQRNSLRDVTRALSMVVDAELRQRAAIARVLASSPLLDDGPRISAPQLALFEQQARQALRGLEGSVELRSADAVLIDTNGPPGRPPDRPSTMDPLTESPAVVPLRADGAQDAQGGTHSARAGLAYPVERQGRTLLNLTVTILPKELQRIVDAQRLPSDWTAAVLDVRNAVVAMHPADADRTGQLVTPALQRHLQQQPEGLFDTTTARGTAVSGYFSTTAQGWTYVTAMPQPPLAGLVPPAVQQVVGAAIVLLLLAIAGALAVSRRIVAPVLMLKRTAALMQSGAQVPRQPTGIAECDEVADALADASETLVNARADLQRQVEHAVARTRAAEQRASQSQRVEALGRLTGGVAHDFNNLLGVIGNSAHLIQRHAHDPALQPPLAATLRAVEMGSRLTQHLLRFAGRQPVHPRVLMLRDFVLDLQELLGAVLGSRIQLVVSVAPDTAPVQVDTSEFELALINLALNARDAMPLRGHLWLSARNATGDEIEGLASGDYVLVAVTDDGTGMTPDLAERVFEPFFSTKPTGHGTGLGLAQVHGFCTQAGGTARLATTPGLGSTVSLILPRFRGAADAGHAPGTAAAAGAAPLRHRVLLVEDHEDLGDITAALLTSLGAMVTRVRSAEQALAALERRDVRFDVVLSDVVMPGTMDGLALARVLRARSPPMPVVLISGFSSALAGVADFTVLRKPCSPQTLTDAITAAMTASITSAPLAGADSTAAPLAAADATAAPLAGADSTAAARRG